MLTVVALPVIVLHRANAGSWSIAVRVGRIRPTVAVRSVASMLHMTANIDLIFAFAERGVCKGRKRETRARDRKKLTI